MNTDARLATKLVIFIILLLIFLHFCCLKCFLLCCFQSLLFLHRWVFSFCYFRPTWKFLLRWGRRWWTIVLSTISLAPPNINVLKFSEIKDNFFCDILQALVLHPDWVYDHIIICSYNYIIIATYYYAIMYI